MSTEPNNSDEKETPEVSMEELGDVSGGQGEDFRAAKQGEDFRAAKQGEDFRAARQGEDFRK